MYKPYISKCTGIVRDLQLTPVDNGLYDRYTMKLELSSIAPQAPAQNVITIRVDNLKIVKQDHYMFMPDDYQGRKVEVILGDYLFEGSPVRRLLEITKLPE